MYRVNEDNDPAAMPAGTRVLSEHRVRERAVAAARRAERYGVRRVVTHVVPCSTAVRGRDEHLLGACAECVGE